MSRPGQFYYDRASRAVVYWPLGGKDPNTSTIIVPTTTRMFHIAGYLGSRPWNITFSNLTMKVSAVDIENEGSFGYLWNYKSLITAKYCNNLTMDSLTMGWTAGNAVGMEYDFSSNTVFRNSEVGFCGGGGVAIRTGSCVISNNSIHDIGLISWQSPGVRVSTNGLVTRNNIFNCKMTAVGDHDMDHCVITWNNISNAMTVLRDMGAFYCYLAIGSGSHPNGNIVANNLFQNIGYGVAGTGSDPRDYFRPAIYFDEQTSNSVAQSNIVINSKVPFFCNIATSNAVLDNVFVNTNGETLRLYASSDSRLPNRVERNIFYSSTNIVVDNPGAWNSWARNLFWSTQTPPLTNGAPTGASIADPLFDAVSDGLFTFQAGSSAPQLGIVPLSFGPIRRGVGNLRAPKSVRVVSTP
jgi:hypothetical protein